MLYERPIFTKPLAYTDVMLDLETLGQRPGCVLLSVGACLFNFDNDATEGFEAKLSVADQEGLGLTQDPATVAWWATQPEEARRVLAPHETDLTLKDALERLTRWLGKRCTQNVRPWSNGADFDLPILQAAHIAVGLSVPWRFYRHRCFRTVKELYRSVPAPKFEGVQHNALADAAHQVRWLKAIVRVSNACFTG